MTQVRVGLQVVLLYLIFSLALTVANGHGSTFSPSYSSRCRLSPISDGLVADCSSLGFKSIPLDLPDIITGLLLADNEIIILKVTSFPHLPRLKKLDLHHNGLSSIQEGTFDFLTALQELSLSQNHLVGLPVDLFHRNQDLEVLDFTGNLFSSVPILALRNATDLKNVILTGNKIETANFTGFLSRKIDTIDLSSNKLANIHADQFFPLVNTNIEIFELPFNGIASLPDCVFSHLRLTKNLMVDHNLLRNFSIYPFLGMESLIGLDVSSNQFDTINPFNNSTPCADLPPLEKIILSGHSMFALPSKAFVGLGNLKLLDLSKGKLNFIENDSFTGMASLEVLDMSSNRFATIRREVFQPVTRLHTINLARNRFKYLPSASFQGMRSLRVLDFTNNQINGIGLNWDIPTLQSLDLSRNRLFRINDAAFYGLPNLTELAVSSNPITEIKNNAFEGVELMQILTLRSLESIGSGAGRPFRSLSRLISLDLSGSNLVPSSVFFRGLTYLKELRLRSNLLIPNKLWDKGQNFSVFAPLTGLEYLSLSSNRLNSLIPGTFQDLTSLTRLLLDKCGIVELPAGLFRNLTSLRYLYLTHNNIKVLSVSHFIGLNSLGTLLLGNNAIKELDVDLFENTPKISYVYLSNNLITVVQRGTRLPKVYLDLSNNPMSCVCELQWFLSYLDTSNLSLVNSKDTICSPTSIQRFIGKRLLSSRPDGHDCGPNTILLGCIPVIILVLIVVIATTYFYRWRINYKLFHLKLAVLGFNEFEDVREHQDFGHDLNVIYHDDNEEWVEGVFQPGIDNAFPEFQRIAYGDRDLAFGMYYMDAVIDLIENSFKVAFIVSNTAIRDHGFINKFHIAVDHMNDVGFEKLVLVFVEDIPDNHLPYLMRLFLSKNKPYFLWSENRDWQNLFWAKFVKLMKANKQINDVLPT